MAYSCLPTFPLIVLGIIEPLLESVLPDSFASIQIALARLHEAKLTSPSYSIAGALQALLTPTDFYNAQDPTYTPTTLALARPVVPTAAALLTAQTANAYFVFALLALAFSWTMHARSVKVYLLCVGLGDIGHMLATYKVLGGEVVFDPWEKWTVMVWGHLGIGMVLNVVRWGTLAGAFGPLEAGGATGRKVKGR
jgi:hypothetical protein